MILQTDTIATSALGDSAQAVVAKPHVLTPGEVISWLPADATPEQQDSAVQANIKPGPIHWSTQPDTLHLPGQPKGKSFRDVSLPQYYKQSFFSKSPMFHPELKGGRLGVAGDPVPYTVAGDNLITGLLLLCFVFASIAFSRSREFIYRQLKNFFYAPRTGTTTISETSSEIRYQFFFVLQTCLLFSIGYFFYNQRTSDTFILEQYQIIGIFTAVFASYFLLKPLLYILPGMVFFGRRQNDQWSKTYLFLISSEGVLLFPVIMLLSYFGFSMEGTIFYTLFVVILVKILSFYKCYTIFFKRNGGFLQLFLYFCALEMMPLGALWGVLTLISSYLKINF